MHFFPECKTHFNSYCSNVGNVGNVGKRSHAAEFHLRYAA